MQTTGTVRNLRSRLRRRGFALVAFSVALFVIIGAAGLAVDLGRMYIARNEAQSFTDAAAIAAAVKLDGSAAGITAARAAALATKKSWNFATQPLTSDTANIVVTFGTSLAGTFVETPASPSGYVCARVTVTDLQLHMWLLPVLTRALNASIGASATAKQVKVSGPGPGVYAPFSPFAHPSFDPTPVNPAGDPTVPATGAYAPDPFDMKSAQVYGHGGIYTLLWPGTNQLDVSDPNEVCENDRSVGMVAYKEQSGNDNRGYIYNESSTVTDAIMANLIPDPSRYAPINEGDNIYTDYYSISHGAMHTNIINALADRSSSDFDHTSAWYSDYKTSPNSGRRLIIVPVNAGPCGTALSYSGTGHQSDQHYAGTASCTINGKTYAPYEVIGFAQFFLLTPDNYSTSHGNQNACAEYVGPAPVIGGGSGAGGPGVYVVKLIQ